MKNHFDMTAMCFLLIISMILYCCFQLSSADITNPHSPSLFNSRYYSMCISLSLWNLVTRQSFGVEIVVHLFVCELFSFFATIETQLINRLFLAIVLLWEAKKINLDVTIDCINKVINPFEYLTHLKYVALLHYLSQLFKELMLTFINVGRHIETAEM